MAAGSDAEHSGVCVGVILSQTPVQEMVPIESVGVEPSVHAFAGTTAGEAVPTAHETVHDTVGDEVI